MSHAEHLCKSVSLHLMLSSALIFFFIWINIDALFLLIPNGTDYEAGKSVVLILGLTKVMGATLFVSSSALNYSRYYYWTLVITALLTITAVGLNVLLIPKYGMDGAALSQFISYFVYYVCLLWLVHVKLDVNIFSKRQMKVLVLVVVLWLMNFGWANIINPLFLKLIQNVKIAMLSDAVVKTTVLALASVLICYYWTISNEVNHLIRSKILRIKEDQ